MFFATVGALAWPSGRSLCALKLPGRCGVGGCRPVCLLAGLAPPRFWNRVNAAMRSSLLLKTIGSSSKVSSGSCSWTSTLLIPPRRLLNKMRADCVVTMSLNSRYDSLADAFHSKSSRSFAGRIARRSDFISSSRPKPVPPASLYSRILASNSAIPVATDSRSLMGLVCNSLTSPRSSSSRRGQAIIDNSHHAPPGINTI